MCLNFAVNLSKESLEKWKTYTKKLLNSHIRTLLIHSSIYFALAKLSVHARGIRFLWTKAPLSGRMAYPLKVHSLRQNLVRNPAELALIWANRPLLTLNLNYSLEFTTSGIYSYKKLSIEDHWKINFTWRKFKLIFIFVDKRRPVMVSNFNMAFKSTFDKKQSFGYSESSCSRVGKPLYYHTSNPGSIPRGGHTNRSPFILALLGQLSLPSFWGR